MGGGTHKRSYFTCLRNYGKTNKAATTCDIGPCSRRLVHMVQDWYTWYKTSTCGKWSVDVWYLWYKFGSCGTRLVHAAQGHLMSGTCGTGLVRMVYGQ